MILTNFNTWFKQVENKLLGELLIDIKDLPDWDWYSHWEEGFSPNEAVAQWHAQNKNELNLPDLYYD